MAAAGSRPPHCTTERCMVTRPTQTISQAFALCTPGIYARCTVPPLHAWHSCPLQRSHPLLRRAWFRPLHHTLHGINQPNQNPATPQSPQAHAHYPPVAANANINKVEDVMTCGPALCTTLLHGLALCPASACDMVAPSVRPPPATWSSPSVRHAPATWSSPSVRHAPVTWSRPLSGTRPRHGPRPLSGTRP